ncbi:hypothetical protein OM076_28720 [Solirubrobacter ginsenosidimutans]|uniref:TrbL/VirB6 plasmid conjugal transfer protein n=1 Tax=Solirubrobacter ginsenosidimutans TaxID=490573 RepID=A0A9X3N3Q5_9ACTN|nr:hypothetical protein [Solirubrobacter ginsenosidimutans]MDA0164288.1 hypothetical protein [Solirubrobacter ginsenosidimutans]
MKRRAAFLLAATATLMLLAWPSAGAEYRGSDLLGNIAPESQVAGGLADRYPLSAYSLDYHVDVGVTDPEGVPPMIAQWAAAQLWSATSLLVKCTIDLFTWAFSLDLLNGSSGALAPIGEAISSLYENVLGESWMVAAILIAGIWGIWKALVQRRYTETAGALAVSVVFVVIALFFVYQPERTIGQASQWTNTLSLAFLSGANRGALDNPEQAKRQVSDHLFETLVVQPWAVLEFGGLSHCVDTDQLDDDGFPRPVGPHDTARDVCRDHLKVGKDGYGGYAPRFLRQRPGSEERKAEYDALREGQVPADRQFAGYKVDKADAPAVDAQQAGGAFQRLTFSVLVTIGALGAVVLLGSLSLAVILAQVVALVLLGFAPVALIVGIFPGAGHAFFRGWLTKLATAIFIKALYSLVIAIVVAVSAALAASTGSLGFLFAFALQTIFFWAIFLYRKQITNRLVGATVGRADASPLPHPSVMQQGAQAAAKPFTALAAVSRPSSSRQQSALSGASESTSSHASEPATASSDDHDSPATGDRLAPAAVPQHNGHSSTGRFARVKPGDPLRPVPANGSPPEASANGKSAAAAPATAERPSSSPEEHGATTDATPRMLHEDVMRRARELRQRQRDTIPSEWDRG